MDELLELTKRHKVIMDTKNILVSVYTNASGYLWQMMKVGSGTNQVRTFTGEIMQTGY